ncbi:MAG: glycosyltransferase [Candidatus Hadarchaeales archaeon]
MKVLFVLPWSKVGKTALLPGIAGTLRPAFACKKAGMEVIILSDYIRGFPEEEQINEIKFYRLPSLAPYPLGEFLRRSIFLSRFVRKVVEKEKVDLIVCFLGTHHLTYLGTRNLHLLGKPLVLLFDYCFYYRREVPENFSLYSKKLPVGVFYKDRLEKHLILSMLKKATRVQAPSKTVLNYLARDMPRERLIYIPYTVDTDFFSPSKSSENFKKKYGLEGETVVTYHYGHDELLHHFLIHLAPHIEGDFKYFFPGPFKREPLLRLLKKVGLEKKAVVTGMLEPEEVPQAIASSSICLSFEVGATIFTKTLEYASCGKPIVSLYSPGVAEVVRHRREALISSSPEFSGNQEFVAYVEELLEDRKLREKLGKRARERILKGYSYEVVGRMYQKLFDSLLE